MFLSLATTHQPATDLGYLLMKNPDRVHEVDIGVGRAVVFFPQAETARCEAVLVLDIDPVALVRGRGASEGLLDQYVNDRPYAASSFLSVALNRAFRSAMGGRSRERPELAEAAIPLEIRLAPVPVRIGSDLVRTLFEPLGWTVAFDDVPGGASSSYVTLVLSGTQRLADALSHLYVLVPVLDDDKHYWVGEDEIDKLLDKAGAWLPQHPQRDLIARRYLKNQRSLLRIALARLVPEERPGEERTAAEPDSEQKLEAPLRLHDLRLDRVTDLLTQSGAKTVADLGCGEGRLIERLLRVSQFNAIIGLDASARALDRAAARLKFDRPGLAVGERVKLLHGALTYRDARWHTADAAALVEVIEHLDAERLSAMSDVVFGAARPKTIVVTTPNADYNVLFPQLAAGAFRHPDHRFEWTRAEFTAWIASIEERYGYTAAVSSIGDEHPDHGAVTQVAVFTR
jgi:3' terminal RNA ribose 2'-O-methyltransferase Hen1